MREPETLTEIAWYWRIGLGVEASTWESASELDRQARLAEREAWTQNTYGVSATTKESPSSARARRSAVEEHFRVLDTPTTLNPHHKTIELPKPVTQEVADTFNSLFGRAPRSLDD
ncbi:hypothetical protein OAX78_00170 [Planctomycetota bacterium]|nr:hypothetical protein [Planctomycetota bacterium]